MTQERFTTREWLTEVIHQVEEMPPNEYEKIRKDIIEQETELFKKLILRGYIVNEYDQQKEKEELKEDRQNWKNNLSNYFDEQVNRHYNEQHSDFDKKITVILYELKKEKEDEYYKFVQEFSDYKEDID